MYSVARVHESITAGGMCRGAQRGPRGAAHVGGEPLRKDARILEALVRDRQLPGAPDPVGL